MLVLLMTVATGAWAQEPATYKITLAEGTEDADKWTISPNPAPAGAPVTATYSGDKKVKSVKAVKKAAPKPDLLAGEFSVSASKKVKFSKGNLSYASSKWSFFDNQYDYYNSYSADAWDHFGWSTSATDYGMNTSTSNDTYSGDFVDWGATMGDGWRTLTNDEWTYLFDTRTSGSIVFGTENGRYAQATINTDGTGVNGMILFPDGVTIASTEVTTAGTVNAASTYATKCTSAQWTALETKGCVFLPAAGQRDGSSVNDAGSNGRYWSGTAYSTSSAYRAYAFNPGNLYPADGSYRYRGYSVRLVQTVDPLAITPGTISVSSPKDGMQYSKNGGAKTAVTTSIDVAAGDKVQFYGNGTSITRYYGTKITGSGDDFTCKVYGNIMSLVDEENFATAKTLSANNTFKSLFNGNTTLTDASGLLLPATQLALATSCYYSMFEGCPDHCARAARHDVGQRMLLLHVQGLHRPDHCARAARHAVGRQLLLRHVLRLLRPDRCPRAARHAAGKPLLPADVQGLHHPDRFARAARHAAGHQVLPGDVLRLLETRHRYLSGYVGHRPV